jgi:hypothetical protein
VVTQQLKDHDDDDDDDDDDDNNNNNKNNNNKWDLEKKDGMVWTGFIWFRIGTV